MFRGAGLRKAGLWAARLAIAVLVVPALLIALLRVVPPPVTPLMLIRLVEGHWIHRDWVSLDDISPNLQRAVMASEDAKFCQHHGFDWDAIDNAMDRYQAGRGRLLGGSTISMQTAKNLFLWPGRTFLRKGAEAYLTIWLEALLPKKRILELYLNIIEFGPGIYGAEAAAQHFFHISAAQLSGAQAGRLAAVLPRPLVWRADQPGAYVRSRTNVIAARLGSIPYGPDGICPDGTPSLFPPLSTLWR